MQLEHLLGRVDCNYIKLRAGSSDQWLNAPPVDAEAVAQFRMSLDSLIMTVSLGSRGCSDLLYHLMVRCACGAIAAGNRSAPAPRLPPDQIEYFAKVAPAGARRGVKPGP